MHENTWENVRHQRSTYYSLYLGKDPYHSPWLGKYHDWHVAVGDGAFAADGESLGTFLAAAPHPHEEGHEARLIPFQEEDGNHFQIAPTLTTPNYITVPNAGEPS